MNAALAPRRRSSISLTPLIDVVFILLMFFMLTTSFTRERQLELPAPEAGSKPVTTPTQVLRLDSDGRLFLAGINQPVPVNALPARLDSVAPVILRPVPDASVQTIVTALLDIRKFGFIRLSLGSPTSDVPRQRERTAP